MSIATKIDYKFYAVLERVVGEDRADPFHPLNRPRRSWLWVLFHYREARTELELKQQQGDGSVGSLPALIHEWVKHRQA